LSAAEPSSDVDREDEDEVPFAKSSPSRVASLVVVAVAMGDTASATTVPAAGGGRRGGGGGGAGGVEDRSSVYGGKLRSTGGAAGSTAGVAGDMPCPALSAAGAAVVVAAASERGKAEMGGAAAEAETTSVLAGTGGVDDNGMWSGCPANDAIGACAVLSGLPTSCGCRRGAASGPCQPK